MNRLEVIEQVLDCTSCELHAKCKGPVALSGPAPARIAMLGEAPGRTEDERGEPFVGPAGELLRATLAEFGLTDYALINTVSCFPDGTPTKEQVTACAMNRTLQLQLVNPDCVLLLGKVASKAIAPSLGEMKHARRRAFQMNGVIYVSAYHPAAALREDKYLELFRGDVAFFAEVVADVEVNGRSGWHKFIPDSCSHCAGDAIWWGHTGIGWCEIHMPDRERDKFDARMAFIADDLEGTRERLAQRGGDNLDAYMDAKLVNRLDGTGEFAGAEYSAEHDKARLTGQLADVFAVMADGAWHTLSEIEEATGHPGSSISAQLRNLRKERFGSYVVERQSRGDRELGLFEYRVLAPA